MSEGTARRWKDADRQRPENFWTVSTTAMTQTEAEQAAQLIEDRFPEVHAEVIDPRGFMSLALDRWTAEMIREGLVRLRAAGGDVSNMLEELDEFLAYADPYAEGEEPWPGVP